MKRLIQSLRIYIIFTVLLGLGYPLLITFIAQVVLPYRANGSLILKQNEVVGSVLVGQGFATEEYFQSRPSANSYDGANSGGTNLGPSSKKLMDTAADRIDLLRRENELSASALVPADMVLSSASGLDPHISAENALLQAPRVSKKRHIPLDKIIKLIKGSSDPDFVGLWGHQGINVVKLNMALDAQILYNSDNR
jgi:potassium-transporting ATPase KdpC subunit